MESFDLSIKIKRTERLVERRKVVHVFLQLRSNLFSISNYEMRSDNY